MWIFPLFLLPSLTALFLFFDSQKDIVREIFLLGGGNIPLNFELCLCVDRVDSTGRMDIILPKLNMTSIA